MELRRTATEEQRERSARAALFLEEEGGGEEVRVGDCPVGMGGVGTKEEHRGKGCARKVIEDSNAFMQEEGFAVAMLFGTRDFYNSISVIPVSVYFGYMKFDYAATPSDAG